MIFFILLNVFNSIIILFKKYSKDQLRLQYLISINHILFIYIFNLFY
jgi:hypothetical protein